jgi:hypothetical protein
VPLLAVGTELASDGVVGLNRAGHVTR